MKKIDYLKLVIREEYFKKKAWIISAFSIVKEDDNKYKSDSYKGRIVKQPWGYSFINSQQELEKIDDADINEPLFRFKDRLIVDNSFIINCTKPVETTIGNLLFNAIAIVPAFGSKMEFITGKVKVSNIENMIASKLQSTPKQNEQRKNDIYYVDEYLKFASALQHYISSLSFLTTIAATPKSLVAAPGIKEYREKLIKEYGDELKNPVKLAEFESKLKEYDREFLKDDPAYGTFLSGKILDISRKKQFLTIGDEPGFNVKLEAEPILTSLEDGIPTNKDEFSSLINGLRFGSFSRGAETVKGGVAAKTLLRATNNFRIIDNDCGTKMGIRRVYNDTNIHKLVNRYILVNGKSILIENIEQAKQYINRLLIVRSPMYCKSDKDTICRICAGENLNKFPSGLSIPINEVSTIILLASMKLMHGKILSTNKLILNEAIT